MLRHYSTKTHSGIVSNSPWSSLNELLILASQLQDIVSEGAKQGNALAFKTEKYWLGGFDSQCLNCRFLLVEEAYSHWKRRGLWRQSGAQLFNQAKNQFPVVRPQRLHHLLEMSYLIVNMGTAGG